MSKNENYTKDSLRNDVRKISKYKYRNILKLVIKYLYPRLYLKRLYENCFPYYSASRLVTAHRRATRFAAAGIIVSHCIINFTALSISMT